MATSFSGGRSWSTQREPPTMGKQHSTVSLFRKKVFNLRKFSKNTASEYLCGIFKPSIETYFHYVHDLFYIQEIRGQVLTVGSISV